MRTHPKTNARWIIFEKASRWSSAIRVACRVGRRTQRLGRAIIDTRSEADCLDALHRFPASLVTLEITPMDFADCLALTAQVSWEFPAAGIAVVSSCDDGDEAWRVRELALREAGAVAVAENIWQLDRLLNQAESCFFSRDNTRNVPLTDRIWLELPWTGT